MNSFDLLPQTVFEADCHGTISYVNKAGCQALGYRSEELHGMKVFDLVSRERRQAAMDRFRRKTEGVLTDPSRYTIRRKDGSEFPVMVYSSPVIFPDGSTGLRGIMADITPEKGMEAGLLESEERFRTLFEATEDTMFIKDRDLRYVAVNPAMAELVGIPAEKLIGATDRELFDEETAGWIQDHDRRVLQGETVETENSIPVRGRTVIAHVIKVPMRDDTGRTTGVCGIARDVTERRHTEEILLETEERYRTVIEHMKDGVAILSGDRHIYVNQRFLDIFGYERDEVINGRPFNWLHPDDRDMVMERNRGRQQGRSEPPQYKFRGLRADGKVIIIEVSATSMVLQGEPVTLAFLRDITEMELTSQALEAERRRLFDIIDFLPDATLVIDNDKKIIAWNRAMETMTGKKKQDMLGKGDFAYAQAFYGENRPMLIDAVQGKYPGLEDKYQFMRQSGHELYAEARVRMAGGAEPRHLWGAAAPLFDMDGNRIGAIESIRDVTERKRLEDQFLHSQKMEAVGKLAAGIAHDFNNLLSVIMGYASLFQIRMKPDDPGQLHVKEILSATERASHLTRSLLAFSRKQILDMKPLDLNHVVKESKKLLSRLLTEEIRFTVVPADEELVIMADRLQIEQVLMNLVSNARDAVSNGGKITVRIEKTVISSTFLETNGFQKEGPYAVISCTDDGAGMDEETREHVFEPFFTTKEPGKGTGLGLSMVFGIVEQHGGYIHVESEPGKGSIFSIGIPLIRKNMDNPEQKNAVEPRGGSETILLAEDDASLRAFTKNVLERYGYTVFEASHGDEAIERFMENRDTVELLFLDVVMPGRNGREVLDAARAVKPGIKALFYSGYTDDVILRRGLSVGQFRLLKKPVSLEDILLTVREVLDGH